ncbi:Cutinase transcription factor 1 beta [Dirofilaria immitis]
MILAVPLESRQVNVKTIKRLNVNISQETIISSHNCYINRTFCSRNNKMRICLITICINTKQFCICISQILQQII